MSYLFNPAPSFELPLQKGGGLFVEFVYKPLVVDVNGDPVLDVDGNPQYAVEDFPAGSAVEFEIDTEQYGLTGYKTITGTVTVSSSVATVYVSRDYTDAVKHGAKWRLRIIYSDGVESILVNGQIVRADG